MTHNYYGWLRSSPRDRWYNVCESDDEEECREMLAEILEQHDKRASGVVLRRLTEPAYGVRRGK